MTIIELPLCFSVPYTMNTGSICTNYHTSGFNKAVGAAVYSEQYFYWVMHFSQSTACKSGHVLQPLFGNFIKNMWLRGHVDAGLAAPLCTGFKPALKWKSVF